MAVNHGTVWTPIELELSGDVHVDNPYETVELETTFEHESGESIRVPGFWDGDDTWKVRFAPVKSGIWEWSTTADPSVDELSDSGTLDVGEYAGANPIRKNGFLRVGENDRSIVHDDGTPFFWLGDTAWPAAAKATPEEWRRYLAKRSSQGFNVVQTNALPQWDASRPRGRYPFGREWDLSSPNPEYFQTVDELVEMTYRAGIVPALVALWFDYVPGERDARPNTFTVDGAARFGRYLAARYGAYGTVWLVSGDSALPEETLEYYDAAARALHESVTHPLCTLHMVSSTTTSEAAVEKDWFDFHCYQSGHHIGERQRNAYRFAVDSRAMEPTRPVLNGEPCYEDHGYFEEPDLRISRETVRRAAWWSVLSGANAGITYGAHGIWHWHRQGEHVSHAEDRAMPRPWTEALEFPGADDYAFLAEFLSSFSFETLEPRQEAAPDADETVRVAELPEDGRLLAYTPDARSVAVDASALTVDVEEFTWVDPATGREVEAESEIETEADVGESITVEPPFWNGDALLVGR